MNIPARPVKTPPHGIAAAFVGLFLVLYALAVAVAEQTVARGDVKSAFQKLLSVRGEQVDWLVLGASHALPLAYGDVPGRLHQDTGQSMTVLAEIGAGPLYNRFVFQQALLDIAPKNLLYVVDSFAFNSADWNEDRVTDRALLRLTPLRLSTARLMALLVAHQGVDPRGLLDYLSGFSKLNPPDRFPQDGWRGAENFDRKFRPSRYAVKRRIDYLYPDRSTPDESARYLDLLAKLFKEAEAAGVQVTVVKLPVPESFRKALPDEAGFDKALRARLAPLGIPLHDMSAVLDDPALYFDTDHLNRAGVGRLYRDHLLKLLSRQ
ncbi:MAG: hypothetical protein KAT26_02865 [Marinosulfonomonas sp.]|nr:hypothetical protein [Marinosulfonomonas sp.]